MVDAEERSQTERPYKEIFPTAAALLWQDRRFIAAAYPLLVIVSIIAAALPQPSPQMLFGAAILERALQLLFLYLVVTRWIRRLSQTPRVIGFAPTALFFLFGLGIWCLFALPFVVAFTTGDATLSVFALFLFGAACWFSLRYYFYPLPILLGRATLKENLQTAADVTRGEPLLAIKLLLAPLGFMALVTGIAMSPYPDGRMEWPMYVEEAVSGVLWVTAVYLSFAAAVLRIDEQVWRSQQLDPYRTARLSTLEFQGSSWLAKQLRPKHGIGWLAISLLIWAGNWARILVTPPPGTVTVDAIAVTGAQVTLTLHLSDPDYHFRGLQPIYFALAGEQRAVISNAPDTATAAGTDVSLGIPEDNTDAEVTLTFTATRSGTDLIALKDLYLWYRSARLSLLDMQKAAIKLQSTPETEKNPGEV